MKLSKTISKHYRKDLNQIELHKSLFGIRYFMYSNKKGWGRYKFFFKKKKRNFQGLSILWATNRLNYLMEQDPFMDSKTIDYHFNILLKKAEEQYIKDGNIKDSDFIGINPFAVLGIKNEKIPIEKLYPNGAKKIRCGNRCGDPTELI